MSSGAVVPYLPLDALPATTKRVPLDELKCDRRPTLYPRDELRSGHVGQLVRALRAGVALPRPVVDQRNRVIDGHHRVEAYRRELDASTPIEVDVMACKGDRDFYRAAVYLNATHGLPLEEQEKTTAALRLMNDYKMGVREVAVTLVTTEERVRTLTARVAIVHHTGEDRVVAVKRALWPPRSGEPKVITEEQYIAQHSQPSVMPLLTARQLRDGLAFDLYDLSDERLRAVLWEIARLVEQRLK